MKTHNMKSLHDRLLRALIEYDRDRKEARKKFHNKYALGLSIARLHEIEDDIETFGVSVRDALIAGYAGRLLDVLLKAAGEPKATTDELLYQKIYYTPMERKTK